MADLMLGMTKTVVEGALSMTKSAIEDEDRLRKSLVHNLMVISGEFEMARSFLNVVTEDERATDPMTRTLLRQVRDMALDMEDSIEHVVLLDNRMIWWRSLLPSCLPAAAPWVDLENAVDGLDKLKARAEAMSQKIMSRGSIFNLGSKHEEQIKPQQAALANAATSRVLFTPMEETENQTRRRGAELTELITKINNGGLPLQVISVLGDVGTTMFLIKKAYDNPEICSKFSCRAWVKLMHPFNPYEFIRSSMDQFYKNSPQGGGSVNFLSPEEMMVAEKGVLMEAFMKQMSKERHLIVLEDVSTMVDWEAVRVYLRDKKNGSCIVVGTHQLEIASLCVGYPQGIREAALSTRVIYKEDAPMVNKLEIASNWLQKNKLIGREFDLYRLTCLHRFSKGNNVLFVWGMSGVGKSYLVKHYYYQLQVDRQYVADDGDAYDSDDGANGDAADDDYCMYGWVNVSHPFDLSNLSQRLLLDLNPGYLHHSIISAVKDPIRDCHEYLLERKCFIVIDGLQSMEDWDKIRTALKLEKHVVIVITNEESVAEHCASKNYVWTVRGLGFDHAVELFKRNQVKADSPTGTSRNIAVHKCGGLPKVICAVAGLPEPPVFWNSLEEGNLVCSLQRGAHLLKKTLEEARHRDSLQDLFAWLRSYLRSCPDFIKPCIFYLSIFPLSHTIRRRRLVRRWIAEGYARDDKECTAEKNGEDYLIKLDKLSMIQAPKETSKYQVNGFLREYIISESMEENLVIALQGHSKKNLLRTGRHLALYESWDRDRNVFQSIDFSRLRSLTVFGEWKSFFISDKMKLLRVLDLEDVFSDVVYDDVEQMVKLLPLLRFLSLRNCRKVSHLPDSLGDLKHLQTLDIRGTAVTKLPKSIIRLDRLQYIRAGTAVTMEDKNAGVVQGSQASAATAVSDNPSSSSSSLANNDNNNGEIEGPTPSTEAAENPSSSDTHNGKVEGPPETASAKSRPGATDLVPNNCLSKLRRQRGFHGESCYGVKVPRGICKLSNMDTLGVVNISASGDGGILEELKNLTQLHKLGVSGINQNNVQEFLSAISGLDNLRSLSVQVQLDDDSNQGGRLDGISAVTIKKRMHSLKLYLGDCELPSWAGELCGHKLSLYMTKLTQAQLRRIMTKLKQARRIGPGGIHFLSNLHLFLSEFQDGTLEYQGFGMSLGRLEIDCSSRSNATIKFHDGGCSYYSIEELKINCPHVSSLRISILPLAKYLREVWISGPHDDDHKQHFTDELAKFPKRKPGEKVVLRLEIPGSSTPFVITSP